VKETTSLYTITPKWAKSCALPFFSSAGSGKVRQELGHQVGKSGGLLFKGKVTCFFDIMELLIKVK
jgi:hypothetical protein